VVSLLLENGANVHGNDNYIPILSAAEVLTLDELRPARVTPLKPTPENIKTREPGRLEVARILLNHGADVRARDTHNLSTPLYKAASSGFCQVAELLLERGADIEARTDVGESPLHIAARESHFSVVKLLLNHSADINVADNDGWTPVHRAAWNKHEGVVRLLVTRGADLKAKTADGLSILDFCHENSYLERFLLENGAEGGSEVDSILEPREDDEISS
jgi:ankyrin repeat protein